MVGWVDTEKQASTTMQVNGGSLAKLSHMGSPFFFSLSALGVQSEC